MNRSVRRFLLTCLLLVALPIKAFAATGVLACGPNHHEMIGTVAYVIGPVSPAWHVHGEGVTHQVSVEQNLEFDPGQPGLSSDDITSGGHAPHSGIWFKCGTCAPCGAGTALTGNASIHIATAVSRADFPSFAPVHPSAPVGRLDRPPRIILA